MTFLWNNANIGSEASGPVYVAVPGGRSGRGVIDAEIAPGERVASGFVSDGAALCGNYETGFGAD